MEVDSDWDWDLVQGCIHTDHNTREQNSIVLTSSSFSCYILVFIPTEFLLKHNKSVLKRLMFDNMMKIRPQYGTKVRAVLDF